MTDRSLCSGSPGYTGRTYRKDLEHDRYRNICARSRNATFGRFHRMDGAIYQASC